MANASVALLVPGDAPTVPSGKIGIYPSADGRLHRRNSAGADTVVAEEDATLLAIAALTVAADKLIYATGADAFSTCDLTAVARTLLAGSTQAAMRSALGLVDIGQQITDVVGAASASEQILQQFTISGGLLQIGSRIILSGKMEKSGTGETNTIRNRFGTAGTTSDTNLNLLTQAAANRSYAFWMEWVVKDATTLQFSATANTINGYSIAAGVQADITIPNISNALIMSISAQMATGAETPTLAYSRLEVKI